MKYRIFTLLLLLPILFLLSLMMGSADIPLDDIIGIIRGEEGVPDIHRFIVCEIRFPQAVTAMLAGSALATSGLLLQTAFRNPLAGPSVFGIDSGASLGVALVILLIGGSVTTSLGTLSGLVLILLAAFLGAAVITLILLFVSNRVRSNVMLLIIGIMIGYLASSAITLLNFFATEEGVRSYMIWGMGNFSSVPLSHLSVFSLLIIVGLVGAFLMAKPLSCLLLGDNYAENLGVNTRKVRGVLLVITGLLTAVSTAYCGPIAFIGLAVPHITRLIFRIENQRYLLPLTMLVGGCVALLCNVLCSLPANGSIIPLNAITPLLGAPVIIYVILKRQ